MIKYLYIILLIFCVCPVFSQDVSVLEYMIIKHSNEEIPLTEDVSLDKPRSVITTYKKVIKRISDSYHIEPELLASVVFAETYGGGVSGWYDLKNNLSITKQILTGKATIGVTQVTPENIKNYEKVILYNSDIIWQLNQGAGQLSSIRDALYPNTPQLNEDRIYTVLRYYNQGTKLKFPDYSEDPVGHYALAHYKRNLRIRKRIRLNRLEPYYSNEISQFDEKTGGIDIYCFNVLVAQYSIGGNDKKANNYAWTCYKNRERIKEWLK